MDVLKPCSVVEIGTAEGLSALAMKSYLPSTGRLVTFDIIPWQDYPNVLLTKSDFSDGRLRQHVEDLSDPSVFDNHTELLRQAEVIFMDASKDGRLEQVLLDQFDRLKFSQPPLFILDDIRVWNMLNIWRQISRPKLDLTSFGHWSGTGFVEWV